MRVGQYEVLCHRCQSKYEPQDSISRPPATPDEMDKIIWRLHCSHTESSSGHRHSHSHLQQRCQSRSSGYSQNFHSSVADIAVNVTSARNARLRRSRSVSPSKASSISSRLHSTHTNASRAKLQVTRPLPEAKYPDHAIHLLEFQRQQIRRNNGDPSLIRQYDLYSRPQWCYSAN